MEIKLIILFSLLTSLVFSQEKVELKHADKLTGKVVNGQSVREADGNVNFEQGNVKVFCNSAVQYLDLNKVELHGDVKIYQDTLTLYTSNAIYFGADKTAICTGGVTLKDPKATLTASSGIYYFSQSKALFKGDVKIVNPEYVITSDELTYLRNTQDSFAKGHVIVTTDSALIKADNIDFYKLQGKTIAISNVSIYSDSTTITSDTLFNFSFEKKSVARSNVKIVNPNNNVQITGNYLENYEATAYSFIKGNAKFIQIGKENDTLFIYSDTMEAFRKKPEYYRARDSVEMIKDKFTGKCNYAIYHKTNEQGKENMTMMDNPIIWQENMQMTGDSIYATLKESKMENVYARKIKELKNTKKSLVIIQSTDTTFPGRFDQIAGENITMYFKDGKLTYCEVNKNSNSIYFLWENKKANGVNISEGDNMFIYFDSDQKVEKIRIDKDPKGQYIPEVLINSANLRLPEFNYRTDRPVRR